MRQLFLQPYVVGLALAATCCVGLWFALADRGEDEAVATSQTESQTESSDAVRVEVTKPLPGGIEHTTTQTGTLIAFESAQLFSKVSGYLSSQTVDIGDHVKQGQVLAEIDSPELVKAVDQARATLDQNQARVAQADARVLTAKADREAAAAAILKANSDVEKAAAARQFREKQYRRISDLFKLKSVEERLVDEQQSEMESARAAEHAATADVASAKALADAAAARVEQAKADAIEARAEVEVARANLAKAEVFVKYLKIVSPYDGVVTNRNYFRGDFIRSADQQTQVPLLAVDRTDLMRVVVQVPDRDVPLTNRGEKATIEIDALPGRTFTGTVSRVADAQDSETRTMRTEVDLSSENGLLRHGMFGHVTILLPSTPGAMHVPSTAVARVAADGKGTVYVAREGVAHAVSVQLGRDNGHEIEVLKGLSADDDVIFAHSGELTDGTAVSVARAPENANPTDADAAK